MKKDNKITFQELEVWDIFQTETGDYYIKINPTNGFNSIILTGKEVECYNFDGNIEVSKF